METTYEKRIEDAISHLEYVAERFGYDRPPAFRMSDLSHDPAMMCGECYMEGTKDGYLCSIDREADGWWCRIEGEPGGDCFTVAVWCDEPEQALAVALEQGWPCGQYVDGEGNPVDPDDLD